MQSDQLESNEAQLDAVQLVVEYMYRNSRCGWLQYDAAGGDAVGGGAAGGCVTQHDVQMGCCQRKGELAGMLGEWLSGGVSSEGAVK